MRKIIPLWLVIFISFFCYASMLTMFIPLLQNKPLHFNIGEIPTFYKNILSGIFLALYPLGQFFGSPIIGALSDKFGRKKILTISLSITVICLLIIVYAIYIKSLILLATGCFIAGLGESNMALALSALADITTDTSRSSAFAKAFVMGSLGYITGSMFGGIAYFIGYISCFVIEIVFIIGTLISILLFFTDSIQTITHKTLKQILLSFFSIFHKTDLRLYYIANFLMYFACFGVLRVQLIYMQEYFHLTQLQISIFCAYASIIAMLGNFLLTPFLLKRMAVKHIIVYMGFAAFLSTIIFILPSKPSSLWVTITLLGLFIPITVAMIGALISNKAAIEHQGSVMGNNQSLQVLAEAISALIGGVIYALNQQSPFVIFAVIGFISLSIYKYKFD